MKTLNQPVGLRMVCRSLDVLHAQRAAQASPDRATELWTPIRSNHCWYAKTRYPSGHESIRYLLSSETRERIISGHLVVRSTAVST